MKNATSYLAFLLIRRLPLALLECLVAVFIVIIASIYQLLSRIMGFKNEFRAVFSLKSKNTKEKEGELGASSALIVSERCDTTSATSEESTGK